MNEATVAAFEDYARLCFTSFGDRVQHWITINEPWTVAVNGHATGIHAPGHQSTSEPYINGHNLLLAHVRAVKLYKAEFQRQGGAIGLANSGDFRYPKTSSQVDAEAAQRAMEFQFGWFTDPLFLGNYPRSMRERLGQHRLPTFASDQLALLLEWGPQTDFIGLNYYSSLMASEPKEPALFQGYWGSDIHVDFTHHPPSDNDNSVSCTSIDWTVNDMGWPIVPDGLRENLHWIAKRYNSNPLVYITENGSAEKDVLLDSQKVVDDEDYEHRQQPYYIHDEKRRSFLNRICEPAPRPCRQQLREVMEMLLFHDSVVTLLGVSWITLNGNFDIKGDSEWCMWTSMHLNEP